MTISTLDQQKVIIIGGSSGIGLAAAHQAAALGAEVIIAGRSAARLEQAQSVLQQQHAAVTAYPLDNQNHEQLQQFFAHIGHFHHLFTPGASYSRGSLQTDNITAESSFNGKFWPQYYAAKYAAPYIDPQGSIVLMSGAFSQRPTEDGAAYGACNGAIESLGKALAVELAPVRVNVVSPGTIWRDGEEGARRQVAFDQYSQQALLKRTGYNEEVAHTVLYLMTNTYTTGSTLFPDGGYVLR